MTENKIRAGLFSRDFQVAERAIDEEARTVEVAFSSEEPVERFFGFEILDHGRSAVDLGRLRNGAAVLVNHDPDQHVGVVEKAAVRDRRGAAVLRFGKGARADEVFRDVIDGIRSHVSVSYRIHELELEKSGDDGNTYRATRWTPVEISLVGVPADATVGVGRNDDGGDREIAIRNPADAPTESSDMPENSNDQVQRGDEPTTARPGPAPAPVKLTEDEKRELEESTRKGELTRMREIEAIGRQFGLVEFAQEHLELSTGINEFRKLALAKLGERAKPLPLADLARDNEIGLSPREVKRFSFLRALRALAFPKDRGMQEAAAYEFECSRAASEKRGAAARGILVPVDVLRDSSFIAPGTQARHLLARQVQGRALGATFPTLGQELVAEDLLSADFITVLRNATAVLRMGATTLSDLEGNVAIPKQLTGASAGWITPEGSDATESEATFGQVQMTPKTLGAWTEYTRQLLLQSSIDIETFVRNDLTIAIGLAMDLAALYGDGLAGAPLGIVGQTGVNPVDYAADDPTWDEIVALETATATKNALLGSLGYIVDAAFRGYAKTTLKSTGVAGYIWEPGDTVNGYMTAVTNQVAEGDQFFGNWADLLIGMWGGLDLITDPYTKSTSGNVVVTGLQSIDIAVRHGESFSYGTNATP